MKLICLILCILLMSCQMNGQFVEFEGNLVIKSSGIATCTLIYPNNTVKKFHLPNNDSCIYTLSSWFSEKNTLLCIENIQSQYKSTVRSNLVLIDTNGLIVRKIYQSLMGEYVEAAFTSSNDSLLIFSTRFFNKKTPDDIFTAPISLHIMNLSTNEVIKKIENVSPRINFEMNETPWSPNGKQFVYSIHQTYKSVTVGESSTSVKPSDGIYIYTITSGITQKISENGRLAIWDPTGDYIAFVSDNNLYRYNVQTNEHQLLYKSTLFEKIMNIHWTPNGSFIFINSFKSDSYEEKMIDINSMTLVNFNRFNIGPSSYSWR